VSLQHSRQEALREEHVWETVGIWISFFEPSFHEGNSFNQVGVPRTERLERRIGDFHPVEWLLVVLKSNVHLVKLVTHHNETFNGQVNIG
jgi:hypothetical protein